MGGVGRGGEAPAGAVSNPPLPPKLLPVDRIPLSGGCNARTVQEFHGRGAQLCYHKCAGHRVDALVARTGKCRS
jgi:hypothetical protein